MWTLVTILLLPLAAVGMQFPFSSTLFKDPSTGQQLYQLQWTFDVVQQTITFNVVVNTTGWVGFGLSPNGGMVGSDVVIGWVNNTGAFLQDRYADFKSLPSIDPSQDWHLLSGNQANGWTNLTFTRKWVTRDSRDRDVAANTARVIFSWGNFDPVTFTPQYHGAIHRGAISLNLLGGLVKRPSIPADAKDLTLTIKNLTVPAVSTTYWCAGYKLPSDFGQKRYVIKYAPVLASNVNTNIYVHHILLFMCTFLNETTDLGPGYDCDQTATPTLKTCMMARVIAGWAVGGEEFVYPEGVSLGLGGSGEQYVMLQMHYSNPQLDSNIIDRSGLVITYTSTVPTNEAAVLSVGALVYPQMIIPPRSSSFTFRGICAINATSDNFPPTGITIFANILHTHLSGVGLTLRHMRWNGTCGAYQELPFIDQNLQYDFNLQQFTILPYNVIVLPGDILEIDCIYNTEKRNTLTFGGEATTDEMCVSFPIYYPRTNLLSCGSIPHPSAYDKFNSKYLSSENAKALSDLTAYNSTLIIPNTLRNGLQRAYSTLEWSQEQIDNFEQATNEGRISAFSYATYKGFSFKGMLDPPAQKCSVLSTTSAVLELTWSKGVLITSLLTGLLIHVIF